MLILADSPSLHPSLFLGPYPSFPCFTFMSCVLASSQPPSLQPIFSPFPRSPLWFHDCNHWQPECACERRRSVCLFEPRLPRYSISQFYSFSCTLHGFTEFHVHMQNSFIIQSSVGGRFRLIQFLVTREQEAGMR